MTKTQKVGLYVLSYMFLIQFVYYYFFMRTSFLNYNFSYNPISILTMIFGILFFLVYGNPFENKLKYFLRNLLLTIPLLIIIFIFILFFSNVLDFFAVISIAVGEGELELQYDLLRLMLTWKYNLVGLNIMVFIMMLLFIIITSKKRLYSRIFKKSFYIGLSLMMFIYILYLFIDPHLLNLLIYIVATFFTLWLCMPIVYGLCQEYDLYLAGVFSAITFSIYMWKFLFWYYQIEIIMV